jgi:hypothetical protein
MCRYYIKKFSDLAFKSYHILKICNHYIHKILSFAPHNRRWWQAADLWGKACGKPHITRKSWF